jgi:hypothetical protein
MRATVHAHWLRLLHASARLGRVLSRHAFSLLSGAVIAAFLIVALTSNGFVQEARSTPPAITTSAHAAVGTAPGATVQEPAAPRPAQHWIIYYLVSSPAQQARLQEAISYENLYRDASGTLTGVQYVNFLVIRDHHDEGHAARLIHFVAESAPRDGHVLQVIDLREPARLTAMEQ